MRDTIRLAYPVSTLVLMMRVHYGGDLGFSQHDFESAALSEVEGSGHSVERLSNGQLGYLSDEVDLGPRPEFRA